MNKFYKVFISKSAKRDMQLIYKYCSNISKNYAEKIKKRLLFSISTLEIFPKGYPKIKIYKNQKLKFRYLTSNNYKILYQVKESIVIIQKIYICKKFKK